MLHSGLPCWIWAKTIDQRARFWNGYLGWKLPPRIKGECEPDGGWPQLIVDPPDGGWPELTEEEKEIIEALAEQHGGYLEESRSLLESNDAWGLVKVGGVAEAILGPIFLFLLLLTLQKRFRLA